MDLYTFCLYILYLIIGVVSGISMGVVGMGAGILTIPFLIYTGLELKQAVAIALIIQLLPQSLPGVYSFYKKGYINYSILFISLLVLIGSLVGIQIGVYLSTNDIINKKETYRILSYFLILSGLYIYYKHTIVTKDDDMFETI